MRSAAPTVIIALLMTGCVPKSDLEKAQAENNGLRESNAQLEQKAMELQRDLDAATAKLAAAETTIARKPPLPVTIKFRTALAGPAYVAVLSTTIKQDLPVLITLKSKSLGTTKQVERHLDWRTVTELGHLEGFTIEPGDEITVTNMKFEPLSASCSP